MKNQPYNELLPIVKLYEEIVGTTRNEAIKNDRYNEYEAGKVRLQRIIRQTFGKNAKIPMPLKDFFIEYYSPMFNWGTSSDFKKMLDSIDKNKPLSKEEHILFAGHFYKCLEKVQEEHLRRYLANRFLFKYSRELDYKIGNILKNIEAELDSLTRLNVYQDALDFAQEYAKIIEDATKDWTEKVSSQIKREEHHIKAIERINAKKSKNAEGETTYTLASEDIKEFKSISANYYRKILTDSNDEYDAIIIEAFNAVRDEFEFEDNPKPIKRKTKDEVIELIMLEFLLDTRK